MELQRVTGSVPVWVHKQGVGCRARAVMSLDRGQLVRAAALILATQKERA